MDATNESGMLDETVFALIASAAQGKIDRANLTTELNLRRDLGLDSLGLVTLIFKVGEELGKDPDDLIEMLTDHPINTVGDVVALSRTIARGATQEAPT
jgi:acyl carrier protein